MPGRLRAAAESTRSLAATAEALAEESRGREQAMTSASEALDSTDRTLATLAAEDPRRSSLHEMQRTARQAHGRAQQEIDLIGSRWSSACSSTGRTVADVAGVLRSDAVSALDAHSADLPSGAGQPTGSAGSSRSSGFSWSDATETAAGVVTGSVGRTLLGVHGAMLLGQRTMALGTMADAYTRRGYQRSMRPLRAAGRAAGRIATLRWRGISSAVAASHAATDRRVNAESARISRAGTVMTHGSGVVRTAGHFLIPFSLYSDVTTLSEGSDFEGTRGSVDRAMAGVGLASTATLAAAASIASPVIVGAAVVGATAAAVWGIGNLVYDHRAAIGDTFVAAGQSMVSATTWAGSGLANAGSAAASGLSSAGTALASGASQVGTSLATGASDALSSVGGFLGFGG